MRARAERLYSELDQLTGLRREARKALVAECRRHPASKVLTGVPTLGVVRVAQLIAAFVTPHRFRSNVSRPGQPSQGPLACRMSHTPLS